MIVTIIAVVAAILWGRWLIGLARADWLPESDEHQRRKG